MVPSFFVWAFLGFIVTATLLSIAGLSTVPVVEPAGRYLYTIASVLGGVVTGLAMALFKYNRGERREYREFRGFIRCWYGGMFFQSSIDDRLTELAVDVRKMAELKLRLYTKGMADLGWPKEKVVNDEAFEEERQRREKQFVSSQVRFYSLYDEVLFFAQTGGLNIKLNERNWKAYAGKPTLDEPEIPTPTLADA